MTEKSQLPDPTEPPDFMEASSPPPAAPAAVAAKPGPSPWLYGVGFLILAGAIFYVWRYPTPLPPDSTLAAQVKVLDQKLSAMDVRLGRLEQMPAPPSAADLGKIAARIDAMEGRIADQTELAARLDTMSGRIEALAGHDQTAIDAIKAQADKADAQIAALQGAAANVAAASARVDRMMRIQAASIALANGRPLGALPNAPPALAQFADKPPPTEGQLRLAFPEVQRSALAASVVDNGNAPFVDRAVSRVEELITIRRDHQVVVGNSSVAALGQAEAALEAGDLGAAVKAMGNLDPGALKAASAWLAQAKTLLEARAALAELAAHA